ncbi:murein hydrolase activator EnvC family protein [Rhodovibrionaceae bacterium A322]
MGALVLAAVFFTATSQPAGAQTSSGADAQLDALNEDLKSGQEYSNRLAREAEALQADLADLRERSIASARRAQDLESELSQVEITLAVLQTEEARKDQALETSRAQLASILAALQRIALQPQDALVMTPGEPLDTVRSAMLLSIAVPQLEAEAEVLRQNLEALSDLREQITAQRQELDLAKTRLKDQQQELETLLAEKENLSHSNRSNQIKADLRLASLADRAEDLKDLIGKLAEDAKRQREREAAEKLAQEALAAQQAAQQAAAARKAEQEAQQAAAQRAAELERQRLEKERLEAEQQTLAALQAEAQERELSQQPVVPGTSASTAPAPEPAPEPESVTALAASPTEGGVTVALPLASDAPSPAAPRPQSTTLSDAGNTSGSGQTSSTAPASQPSKTAALAVLPLEKPKDLRPFPKKPGGLLQPARGRVLERYGQESKKDLSGTSRGLLIQTRNSAQVISPFDGKVVYAGEFRGYGLILIIEHDERYHSLIAGFDRLYVGVDQWILAGEPIGVMGAGGQLPELYLELRRSGQPIDPLPWLASNENKAQG